MCRRKCDRHKESFFVPLPARVEIIEKLLAGFFCSRARVEVCAKLIGRFEHSLSTKCFHRRYCCTLFITLMFLYLVMFFAGIINRVYIGGKIMPGADSRIVEKALEQADALVSQK